MAGKRSTRSLPTRKRVRCRNRGAGSLAPIRSAHLQVWSGRLFLWPGRALYIGPAADTTPHAHHAVQLCLGLDGPFRLRRIRGASWHQCHFALIEADCTHQLDGCGRQLALLYLDPESEEGRAVGAIALTAGFCLRSTRNLFELREGFARCADASASPHTAARMADALVETIAPVERTRTVEPRVARFLQSLRRSSGLPMAAGDAARLVGLSSSRFQHLFRESIGIPFRRYLLWLRLVAAVERIASGCSLTEAAHDARFSDSAHLSRTFRRMFGLSPSALARVSRFVQAAEKPLS